MFLLCFCVGSSVFFTSMSWPWSYEVVTASQLAYANVFYALCLCLQRMNLVVKADLPMLIAGSSSPCVLMTVSAIGVTDTAEKNKEHSAKIFQFLQGELGLSDDR